MARLKRCPTFQKQIPFENDRQKNKSKSRSFALLRMTNHLLCDGELNL